MDALEQFYYDNAGYWHDPAKETAEEGRVRCARQMAMANRFAVAMGLEFEWSDDWELSTSHADEFCEEAYPDGEPDTCEQVDMFYTGPCGHREMVSSLGCIDDATDDYRRVVEAELALEWLRTGGKV